MLDILVHASSYSAPTNSMRYAAQLTNLLDGSLTSLFVAEPVVPLWSAAIAPVPEIHSAAAQIVKTARHAEALFQSWARSLGVIRHRWQVETGLFASSLALAANWHDALVLGCGGQSLWSSVGMLGEVLIDCDLPCFVVPDAYEKPASLDSIVIASHGSPEAVRAVHAALPLLARAKRILLVQGRRTGTPLSAHIHPAFSVEEHLQQHGLAYNTHLLDAADEHVGAAILDTSVAANADLLVMGAYGRTRFSEWVLGGVTRYLLENANVPLFLRH